MSIIGIVLVVSVVLAVMYYAYNYLYLPKQQEKDFSDVANTNPNGKTVTIFFFHVDWCPHCQRAMPDWAAFYDKMNDTVVNGFRVECKSVDCTNNKDSKINSMLEAYKVEYFPTVIGLAFDKNGKEMVVSYEAKVTRQNLEKFAVSLTQQPSGM